MRSQLVDVAVAGGVGDSGTGKSHLLMTACLSQRWTVCLVPQRFAGNAAELAVSAFADEREVDSFASAG